MVYTQDFLRGPAMRSATTNPDLGLIATPSRLVLIAARGNHAHRALTRVRRISLRGTARQDRAVCSLVVVQGVLMLSACN